MLIAPPEGALGVGELVSPVIDVHVGGWRGAVEIPRSIHIKREPALHFRDTYKPRGQLIMVGDEVPLEIGQIV
jgi:hypothetical protein